MKNKYFAIILSIVLIFGTFSASCGKRYDQSHVFGMGDVFVGTKAPDVCPTCAHPQSYFEISAKNY